MKRIRLSARIPTSFRYLAWVMLDEDFKPFPKSPLKIKVVVCANGKTLRKVSHKLGKPVERSVYAYVDDASGTETHQKTGKIRYFADCNYFCVMVFQLDHVRPEIIAHESVHAGFSVAKRGVRDPWRRAFSLDEEWVAYPAGIVAGKLHEIFRRNGIHRSLT